MNTSVAIVPATGLYPSLTSAYAPTRVSLDHNPAGFAREQAVRAESGHDAVARIYGSDAKDVGRMAAIGALIDIYA